VPDVQLLPDPIAGRADYPSSSFVCSTANVRPDATWVRLSGELDIETATQLEHTLDQSRLAAPLVVLDLRDLAFIDSAGVHAIVNASSRARQSGRTLLVLRGSANVDRMFALGGCSEELEIGEVDAVEPLLRAQPEAESAA
jgi:anti-sigma B factor antagonist